MGDAAIYEPTGRRFDFNGLDDDDKAFLAAVPRPLRRGQRLFTCGALVDGEPSGVEVQIKRSVASNWFSAHYPGEGHLCYHDTEAETIEHQREKEYWHRAAQDVGLTATTELAVAGRKLDVAITGAVLTDIEVQHTAIDAAVVTVWFQDIEDRVSQDIQDTYGAPPTVVIRLAGRCPRRKLRRAADREPAGGPGRAALGAGRREG